jgi:nicotinamide mononucleotide transporter
MANFLEILGVLVGLVYLYLEYNASVYLWIASVIMPAIYLVVFYGAGLYADTAINIYYLGIAVYGWFAWKYSGGERKELPISHITTRHSIAMVVLYVVMQVTISLALLHFTDSDVAWFNGLTSALSIVGMWMLARKWIEQWIVWIVVDILSAALYSHKGLYLTAILYGAYAVIAIFGYMKWQKILKEQDAE